MGVNRSANNQSPNYTFSLAFNPEIFRLVAYVGLIVVLLAGVIITDKFVDVDPHKTAIYRLFGFNHLCNVLDHEPSRTITAMLLPLWELPFLLYVIFNFLRIKDAYKEKQAPQYTYIISSILLPIEILLTVWFRIVYVWSPEVNFLYHYLPYIGFQVLLFLVAFENSLYFYAVKALPFNNSRPISVGYLVVLLVVTTLYIVIGLSVAFGHPLLDLVNDPGERSIFQALTNFYSVLVIPVPMLLSVLELKRSPNHKLSFE